MSSIGRSLVALLGVGVALWMGVGCVPAGSSLRVDVATELVTGRELARIDVALVAPVGTDAVYAERVERLVEVEARFGLDLARGRPITTFDGVADGVRVVRVRLFDVSGGLLATTRVQVLVTGDRVVRVRVSRACVEVACPPVGGSATLSACVGGRCVDPRCGPETPELCPEIAFCSASSECARGDVPSCADRACDEGECVTLGDDARCAEGQYCDVVLGCTPRPTSSYVDAALPDAFVAPGVDAGPIDAASGPDAHAPDAGPATLCAPADAPCRIGLVRGGACGPFAELADGTPCGAMGEVCAGGECLAPVSIEELPARWASTQCALLRDCLGDEEVPASCEVRMTRIFAQSSMGLARALLMDDALVLGFPFVRPAYDELGAARCLHALESEGCAVLSPRVGALPAECEGLLRSPVAAAGPCAYDFECGAGWYCGQVGTTCGECQPRRPVPPGAPCLWSGQCAEGYECRNEGTREVCMPLAPCGAGPGCAWPMTCVGGSCRPLRELLTEPVGAVCDVSTGPYCRPGLDCLDDASGTPRCTTPAALGAPCGDQRCAAGGHCVAGVCTATPRSAGEACDGRSPLPLLVETDGEWWWQMMAMVGALGDNCADDAVCDDFSGLPTPMCRVIPGLEEGLPRPCGGELASYGWWWGDVWWWAGA